ncbi:MAG: type I restriction enzyme HsdR N-terminal domain-containing protein [Bacteroidales bacterium]|nr:type I restriction enzyme HsdR N-terminal domain-containing protein [Bacteroidales bacterium]
MTTLNFPSYEVRTKAEGKRMLIFDRIRKKYVALTPEEWVRQHLINYLVSEKGYPATLISVEMPLKYVRVDKRSDVLVNDRNGQPLMLIECKAPEVALTQKVFEQIAVYNLTIQAPCLMLTNGLQHYCLAAATERSPACFLDKTPAYGDLLKMRPGR